MCNLLTRLSALERKEKRYWAPTLIGVGASISFLGLSFISAEGVCNWAGWVDIGIGLGMVWWGSFWAKKPETPEE